MIKAIETEYNGFRFRSRTEARWAVLLNQLDINWKYEPHIFTLESGIHYLPDFWLPYIWSRSSFKDPGAWLEIKGKNPTKKEIDKAKGLGKLTQFPVFIAVDDPFRGHLYQFYPVQSDQMQLCLCHNCRKYVITELLLHCCPLCMKTIPANANSQLLSAKSLASSYRFR